MDEELRAAATAPRALADPAVLAARRARLDEPHVAPLNALVVQVERTTGRPTPRVDPDGGGTGARVLLLLETPSATATYASGLVSPDNDDATAANLWSALRAGGPGPRDTVVWNAVPWSTGTPQRGARPTAGELRLGRTWLTAFLELLPRLAVVVALGRSAQAAVAPLDLVARGLVVLLAPHPSQRVYNRPGLGARQQVHAVLAEAAAAARAPQDR